ncbi:MAG: hypothetical protein ACRDI0_03000 [Actinomycetota bacterium]
MLERREGKRRAERLVSAAIALALAIAVIGGTMAVLSGLARDRVQPGKNGVSGVDPSNPSLQACIERTGYDWDKVYPLLTSGSPPPEGSVFADPAFRRAWEACLVETGLVGPFDAEESLPQPNRYDEERIAEENRDVLAYLRCMGVRGWDLPDPEPWQGEPHPGLLTARHAVPGDPEAANRYFRDSAECGHPFFNNQGNLLPLGE